jgi:hypothetical protein
MTASDSELAAVVSKEGIRRLQPVEWTRLYTVGGWPTGQEFATYSVVAHNKREAVSLVREYVARIEQESGFRLLSVERDQS